MIPGFDYNGVIPPYLNDDPTTASNHSPYAATLAEVAEQLGTTPERRKILRGLIRYRDWLRSTLQPTEAFQWLDGSFVEDCEATRQSPPGDIDLLTFYVPPQHLRDTSAALAFHGAHAEHFDTEFLKEHYHCDAYTHDLLVHPAWTVKITRFWYGLFSHQRGSRLWKGMIEVPLTDDDAEALKVLDRLDYERLNVYGSWS